MAGIRLCAVPLAGRRMKTNETLAADVGLVYNVPRRTRKNEGILFEPDEVSVVDYNWRISHADTHLLWRTGVN